MKITSQPFLDIESRLDLHFVKHGPITLIPNVDGSVEYFPQREYDNKHHHPFLDGVNMDTPFCKFKPNLPKGKGVYLWVMDEEIIYLGEAEDLYSRFNSGYGNISPRNPYKGGQNTNVKMNRVALDAYKAKKTIDIHYVLTPKHKEVEKYLLDRIYTKYNVQNN